MQQPKSDSLDATSPIHGSNSQATHAHQNKNRLPTHRLIGGGVLWSGVADVDGNYRVAVVTPITATVGDGKANILISRDGFELAHSHCGVGNAQASWRLCDLSVLLCDSNRSANGPFLM
ncbi:hypothetical protein TNCV_279921 [Trichonephila clavipes]|nr:hypothetical protein TNCV_279921 [Trichonephila clavipes]